MTAEWHRQQVYAALKDGKPHRLDDLCAICDGVHRKTVLAHVAALRLRKHGGHHTIVLHREYDDCTVRLTTIPTKET